MYGLASISDTAIAAAGWIVAVILAVVGWYLTQREGRRAVRRNMRIDYLLEAYRRLERSSNRPMTPNDERDVEAAVADIQLLGSPSQVELAIEFAKSFEADGASSSYPLLQDLRISLRNELLLETLPAEQKFLRISRGGDTLSDSSRIWHDTDSAARRAIDGELAGKTLPADLGQEFPDQMRALAVTASPEAAIEASIQRVELVLRDRVQEAGPEGVGHLTVAELATRALELGIIDAQLADAINGLSTMRIMAILDQGRIDTDRAMEFVGLCAGVLFVLGRAVPT